MSRRLIGFWCLVLVALTGAAAPADARSSGTGSPPAALGCDPNGNRWAQTITGGVATSVSVDPFGSMLTTPGQSLAHADAYDPYRTAENPSVAPGSALGYRGELTLSGTVSLRARDYDPTTGVFLSLDPLDDVAGTPTSGNGYHYVYNDPLNRVDPTGMRPDDCAFRIFGACQDRDDFIKGATFVASTAFGFACGTAVLGATSLTGPAAAMLAGGATNTCAGYMSRAITRYAYGNNAAKAPWDPQALTTDAATGIATAGAFHYGGRVLNAGISRHHALPRGQIGNNPTGNTTIAPTKQGFAPRHGATDPASASPSSFTRTEALSGRPSTRKMSELAESMRTGGWRGDPIKVIEHNGQRIVVDGHHRVAAARAAGIDVPYEVVDPSSVIGPGQWSSLDDILSDSYSVGPDRIRPR